LKSKSSKIIVIIQLFQVIKTTSGCKKSNRQQQHHQCLIIGSFRKHYKEILRIIDIFHNAGVKVFSPKKSFIINPKDEFVIFDYDPKNKSKREIEDAVLKKIHNVDFVYLANF